MYRCLIIDDEPLAVQLLSDYVQRHESCALAVAHTDPYVALRSLDEMEVDLILLDIQMPELSGMQFAKIVQGRYPVILTTAYEEFALQGYELDVIDYLLKPIAYERFEAAIHRLQERLQPKPAASDGPTGALSAGSSDVIFVKSGYRTQRIDLEAVLYLEGLSDYVRLQTQDGPILTLDTLRNFEQTLPTERFVRVHKSYIVALPHIDYIERSRIIIGEQRIPIGATYQEAFWQRIRE